MTTNITSANAVPFPSSSLTLEDLATRVVVETQQVGHMKAGYFGSNVIPHMVFDPTTMTTETIQSVVLTPAYHYWHPDCPRNFGMVVDSAQNSGLTSKKKALSLYVKSKLYYSCAVTVSQFIAGVIPKLEESYDVTELPVRNFTNGNTSGDDVETVSITLTDLAVFGLAYRPNQRHSFLVDGTTKVTVEDFDESVGFASHMILICSTTGIVVDLTFGQFTGNVKPGIFRSYAKYEASFPGQIIRKYEIDKEEGLPEFTNELWELPSGNSPDFHPVPFGERVVHQIIKGSIGKALYCEVCLGVASSKGGVDKLSFCSGCNQVCYCSKHCQALHWKEHKKSCRRMSGRESSHG